VIYDCAGCSKYIIRIAHHLEKGEPWTCQRLEREAWIEQCHPTTLSFANGWPWSNFG
jgi:hypothetical protein